MQIITLCRECIKLTKRKTAIFVLLLRYTPDAEMSPFSLLGTFANAGLPRLRLGGETLERSNRRR